MCGVLSQKEMRNFSFICDGVVLISAFFFLADTEEKEMKKRNHQKNRNDGGRWVGERVATLVRIDD